MEKKRNWSRTLGTLAVAGGLLMVIGALAGASFVSNPQSVESHGSAGNISSTVTPGNTSIAYGTPGLSGYASCVEAPYGPLSAIDVVVNFTNAAPGDNCTWSVTLTDTGTVPGVLNASMGLSSYNVCATATSVNCYLAGNSLTPSGTTITAGGTYLWTGYIELAPGSTVMGLLGSVIWNAHESIGS